MTMKPDEVAAANRVQDEFAWYDERGYEGMSAQVADLKLIVGAVIREDQQIGAKALDEDRLRSKFAVLQESLNISRSRSMRYLGRLQHIRNEVERAQSDRRLVENPATEEFLYDLMYVLDRPFEPGEAEPYPEDSIPDPSYDEPYKASRLLRDSGTAVDIDPNGGGRSADEW